MKKLVPAAMAVSFLMLGFHAPLAAQAVDPSAPGSASGGVMAQAVDPSAPGSASGGVMAQTGPAPQGQPAPSAGQAGAPAARAAQMDEDQVRSLLRARGYTDISDVERDGDTVSAKAKRDGREVRLRVDTSTGTVTQQAAN
ncbi:PepSY domain-containing protein [Crenalkalicoccus roseus]|uniref:PepSY domain-containing protein n=1 Tax=Crenalkalicoccus roseus TaxID=1485588 RepID=UPI0013052EBC|nr:PepSY domain-containing protein [Crenalkalicoccus roseus]